MTPEAGSEARETASATPDGPIRLQRKRKRNVLSCLDCRRRKVKCDHGLPACSRCVLRGVASSCTYEMLPGDEYGHQDEFVEPQNEEKALAKGGRGPCYSNPPNGSMATEAPLVPMQAYLEQKATITRLEDRLSLLERIVARGDISVAEAPPVGMLEPESEKPRQPEIHLFKGRGFRTQFYGTSCPTSLLASFPEIKAIMKEAYGGSILQRLQGDRKAVEARFRSTESRSLRKTAVDLVSLVPARAVTDAFVRLYITTFEKTYRVLHEPSFWSEYDEFWNYPEDSKPGFIAVLLLILATVRCMSPEEDLSFDLDGSSSRTEAISWIRACDSWLEQQSQKHRTVEMYQVMCLRVLATSANSIKIKQAKIGAEALVEYFRSAGLHRDPSLLGGRCSVFDREMRRRFWATAMELELQASLDRGTPSSLSIPFDCKPPLNINDEDLQIDALQSPTPKPSDQYTSTSYLHIASKSLALRITLCSLINDPRSNLGYDQVLLYEQQVNDALDAIPKWTGGTDKGYNQALTLLDLQLRQYLIMLHTPFARQSQSPQHRYSRMVCFEASKHILDQHSKLMHAENFSLSLIRGDVLLAALSICHNAFLCTVNPGIGDMLFRSILTNFSSLLGGAFKVLKQRVMRRGRGYDQFWWVSAGCCAVEVRLDPDLTDELKLQATERVAELYRKKLEHTVMVPQGPSALNAGSPAEGGPQVAATWPWVHSLNDSNGLIGINDMFDPSDWTLDNLWPLEGVYDAEMLL